MKVLRTAKHTTEFNLAIEPDFCVEVVVLKGNHRFAVRRQPPVEIEVMCGDLDT
jgi:hypothetical protein